MKIAAAGVIPDDSICGKLKSKICDDRIIVHMSYGVAIPGLDFYKADLKKKESEKQK